MRSGDGITAHYLVPAQPSAHRREQPSSLRPDEHRRELQVVFFVGRPLAGAGPPTVCLQEEETDLAVWLSAAQVAHVLAHPLGGAVGTVPVAAAAPGLGGTVALDALAGIYPRAAAAPGEAGGDGVQLGLACAHPPPFSCGFSACTLDCIVTCKLRAIRILALLLAFICCDVLQAR